MTFNSFLFQAINGLASASGLFLVAAGLSLICWGTALAAGRMIGYW